MVTWSFRFVVILASYGDVSNSRDKSSDNGTSSLLLLTMLSGLGLSVEDELFWIASGEVMRDCG